MTAPRTVAQNRADGLYDQYMTTACRGCTPTGGHYSECPHYGASAQAAVSRLPVLTDLAGQLDVDTLRVQAPLVRKQLIDAIRGAATAVRSARGSVVVPEDTYDLTRRTVAAGEVLRQWRDAFEAAAAEADAIAAEEALTAMGGLPGYEDAPAGSLFVPDGEGQRIAVTPDWKPGASTWDTDTLKAWLAEDTVAELGLGEESDRPVLTVQETVSVVRDALDRLTNLGTFTPGARAVDELRKRLAGLGRDADAGILRQIRSVGLRAYKGVKITREAAK
jgi:hypothetical protein